MTINQKKPNDSFGLVIKGFDLKQTPLDEDASYLKNLLYENKLLIFKDMILGHTEFSILAKLFGGLEISHPVEYHPEGYPHIRIQSNVLKNGLDYAGGYWHSDGSWQEQPSKATLLLCLEAPAEGGETLFVDMCAAYNDLSKEMKSKLENLVGYYPCREIYLNEMEGMGLKPNEEKLSELTNLYHPIIKTHPVTGRKAIYLNQLWLKSIDSLSNLESEKLLKYLYDYTTEDSRIYKHKWEKNDLLVWDNASVMHKALRAEEIYPKTTLRITVSDK